MVIVDNIGASYRNILGDPYGYVTLEGTLPDPLRGVDMDTWIAQAARVSYRGKSKTKADDAKLIKRLLTDHHDSPFEAPQMTFSLRAPMMVVVHILRHRSFHINGESSRYKEVADELYTPQAWRIQSKTNKQSSEVNDTFTLEEVMSAGYYQNYRAAYRLYQEMLQHGVAREVARLCLPTDALYKSYTITTDLRNFLHFVNLRSAADAQYETQCYSNAMFALICGHAPDTCSVWAEQIAKEDVRVNLTKWMVENGSPTRK